ncbi:MAG: hypothetical protein MJY89_02605 [Bacteroidales bacterium]|nr:hypothetical protein [Bacteroidales bacterium]
MNTEFSKISTMDELERSLASVHSSIKSIEDYYYSAASGIISDVGTAMDIFRKIKLLFSKKQS